ncbi:MAG: hypothetical protein K8S87_11215 [Planctomycetes bacterium]|nr:hypothetical protein [Planctomycetota bacterium]
MIKEILMVRQQPKLQGIAGEVESLKSILLNKSIDIPEDLLLGVSGLLFRFYMPKNADLVTDDYTKYYIELTDGPDPVRVASRFTGWSYWSHLQNSLSGMFDKTRKSLEAGIPVITRCFDNSSIVRMIVGYSFDESNRQRAFYLTSLLVPDACEEFVLPSDPEAQLLNDFQWRNFIGIANMGEVSSQEKRVNDVKMTLRRAFNNLKPHVLGEGTWAAGASAYDELDVILNLISSNWSLLNLLRFILRDYIEMRTKLVSFLKICEENSYLAIEKLIPKFEELPEIAQSIVELINDKQEKLSESSVNSEIWKLFQKLKHTEFPLFEEFEKHF